MLMLLVVMEVARILKEDRDEEECQAEEVQDQQRDRFNWMIHHEDTQWILDNSTIRRGIVHETVVALENSIITTAPNP